MSSGRHWKHPHLEPGPSTREAGRHGLGTSHSGGTSCWSHLGGGWAGETTLTKAHGVPGASGDLWRPTPIFPAHQPADFFPL